MNKLTQIFENNNAEFIDTGYIDDEIPKFEIRKKNNCDNPKCINGFIQKEDGSMEYCSCYLKDIFLVKMKKSNIPEEYFDINKVDNTNLKCLQKPYGANISYSKIIDINEFLNKYEQNINKIVTEGWNLILEGPTGVGKTTVACLCGKIALKNKNSLYFIESQKLRKIWVENNPEYEEIKNKIYKTDFLIIDDLGAEYNNTSSDFQLSELDLLIRSRISTKKITIITTNANEEDIKNRYKERIFSLLQKRNIHIIMHRSNDIRNNIEIPDFL